MQRIFLVIKMSVTVIRAIILYLTVIIAVRIMGKRQIGELKPHELVVTILVSQVASIPLQDNNIPLLSTIVPIMIFVAFEIIVSALSMKSLTFRNLIQGKPIIVIKDGKLDEKQMARLRLTVDDLIDALRQKDVFDISTVETAVVETNGTVSVLKKADESPVTPKQLNLSVDENSMPITVVMDGKPVTEYFGQEKIKESGIELLVTDSGYEISNIMLLTIDGNGNVFIIPKRGDKK